MGNISSNPDDLIVLTEIGSYLWFQDLQHAKTVSKLLSVVFNGQMSDAAMFRNLLKVFGSTDKFSASRINFNSGYILNRRFVDFPTGSVEWKCLHSSLQSSLRQYLFSSSKHFPTLPIKNHKITLNQNGLRTNMWPSSLLKTDNSEQLIVQSKAPFHKLVSTGKGETTTSTLSCIAYFEVSFTQNSNNSSGFNGDNSGNQSAQYYQQGKQNEQQHFSFPLQQLQQPVISIGICSPVGPNNCNFTKNNSNNNNNNSDILNANNAINLDHSFIYHSNGHTQYIPQHNSASTSPHFALPPTTYSPSDVIGCGIVYPPLCQNGSGQVIFTANGRVVEVINLGDKYTLCVPFFPIVVTNDKHLTPVLNFGTSSPFSFDILSYELQLIQKLFGGSESWDIYESIVLDQDRKYRANLHPLYFHPYESNHHTANSNNITNITSNTNNITNNCSSSGGLADTGADCMIESDSNNEIPITATINICPSLFFNEKFQLACSGLLQQIEQKREDDEVDVSSDSSGADCSSGSDHSQLDYDYDDPISGTYGAFNNACVDDYCNSSDEEQQPQQPDTYNTNNYTHYNANNSSFNQNSTEKPAFRRRKARKFASIMPFDDTTPPNTVENSTFGSGFSVNGLFSSAAPSDTECDMAVDFESWSLDKPLGVMLSSNSYPTLQNRNGSEQGTVANAGTVNAFTSAAAHNGGGSSISYSNSISISNIKSNNNRPHSKSLDYASLADVKRSNTNGMKYQQIGGNLNINNSIYNNNNVNNSIYNNSTLSRSNLNSAISCGYHPDNEDNIEGDDDSVAASLCVEVESVNEEDGTYLNFGADCPYSYDDELLQLHPFNSTTSSMDNGGYLYTDLLLHGSPQLTAMENSSGDHISHKRKRKGRMIGTTTTTNNTANAHAASSGNNSVTGYNSSRPSSSETVPPMGQMETDEARILGSAWNISHGSHLRGSAVHNSSGTVSSPLRTVVQLRHFKGKLQDQTELQSENQSNNNNNNNSNGRNNLTAASSGNNARNIRNGIQRGLSY